MRLADACEILAIDASTSREEAQRAYRKLALENQERPANPSTWAGERWDVILSAVTAKPIREFSRHLSKAFGMTEFQQLKDVPEA